MNNYAVINENNRLPAATTGSLETYIQYVNSISILSKEEEQQLTAKLVDEGDLAAAQKLVLAHLRYVVRVAKGYSGYGLPTADLIQEGTVGLMKAVKRFDPAAGVRLVTFAMHWIKAEIHEFVLKNWRIVKVATTKAQRKLFFRLRGLKKHTNWLTNDEVCSIAVDLGVKEKDVRQMESRLSSHDASFDTPTSGCMEQDTKRAVLPAEYLEDCTQNPESTLLNANWQSLAISKMRKGLDCLDDRSRDILQKRWLNDTDKVTLNDLAVTYNISKERVRQLEQGAITRLRSLLHTLSD